jgi:hypothetical protein
MNDRRPEGVDTTRPTSGRTFPTWIDAWLLRLIPELEHRVQAASRV